MSASTASGSRWNRQRSDAKVGVTAPELRSSVMASRLLNSRVASSLARRALLRLIKMTEGLSASVLPSRVPKSVSAETRTWSCSHARCRTVAFGAAWGPWSRTCSASCPASSSSRPSCGERLLSSSSLMPADAGADGAHAGLGGVLERLGDVLGLQIRQLGDKFPPWTYRRRPWPRPWRRGS